MYPYGQKGMKLPAFRRPWAIVSGCVTLSLCLGGCATPSVNLATNEPIKVDINMRLDVYQHSNAAKAGATPKPTPSPAASAPSPGDPQSRQKARSGDIQTMKNSRLVGEGRDGMLVIRTDPGGEYGTFIRETVRQENADRMEIIKGLSESEKIPPPEIQKREAKLAADRAFKGEWIEIEKDGKFVWIQKQ